MWLLEIKHGEQMNKFKYEIQDFFKKFQIKKKHFASIMGVSQATVTNWCKGKSQPTKPMRERIDDIMSQYYRSMYPDYYSWCCNVIARDVTPDRYNPPHYEGLCPSCWQFGLVSEKRES